MVRTAQHEQILIELAEDREAAIKSLFGKQYQAVLVDFELPEASEILAGLTQHPFKPTAFAVLPTGMSMRDAFGAGSHLVINKPLTTHLVRRSLKLAYNFGPYSRRASPRAHAAIPAVVGIRGRGLIRGSILNVSRDGACLNVQDHLVPGTPMTVRFSLPGLSEMDVGAVAVWRDGARLGVRTHRMFFRHESAVRTWVHRAVNRPR